MKRIFACIIAAGVLAACSVAGVQLTPEQSVYQLKNDYNAALTVAVTYKSLPPCGLATSPLVCSRADVVGKLQQADNVAYPAILAAENTVRTPGAGANAQTAITAATQALAALTSITATLATK